MTLKAYRVDSGNEDGNSYIVFATNNATARHKGASEFDCQWEDLESCRRAPEFDQYAPGPVPPTALLAAGWWQDCLECGIRIDLECEEGFDDENEPYEFAPIDHGTQVFCCARCQATFFAKTRMRAAATSALIEVVEAKFPGCFITRVHVSGERLEPSVRGHGYTASATFNFPGGTSPATWVFGDPQAWINAEDREVFTNLYRAGQP